MHLDDRRQRIRLGFDVEGRLRWLGHLDLFRAWERVLRRAGLPLLYSQGFNPRPRMAIALPLPLGLTGTGELLDVTLSRPVPPHEVVCRISPQLPPELTLRGVEEVDLAAPSLQSQLRAAEYIVRLGPGPADLSQRVQDLMTANSCIRRRRGREYDLRPLIQELTVDHALSQTDLPRPAIELYGEELGDLDACGGPLTPAPRPVADTTARGMESDQVLLMVLEAGGQGTARPDEVLLALGVDPWTADIHRRHIRFAFDN
jgi:radical SAM-linked protein